MWTTLLNEDMYNEAYADYQRLLDASKKSARRGGFWILEYALPMVTQWLKDYRCGRATWDGWLRATDAADMAYCDWRDWYYNSHPTHPRPEWGGLNELEYKTLLLAIESGKLTWDDLKP